MLQHVHAQHPPDEEYGDDGSGDVNDPVANGLRFSEIKHARIVAGPPHAREISREPLGELAGLQGQAFFWEAFTFAHLSRWAAAIFLRAAADIVRLFFGAELTFFACPLFTFAHRSRWAAEIRARAAVESLPRAPFCFP